MDKTKMAARIKALLAKTQENGCTENEALFAAQKAAELMRDHNISMTEAEVLAEGFEMRDDAWESDKTVRLVRMLLSNGVATFTDTRIWTPSANKATRKFFGLRSDMVFAQFLYDNLTEFVMRRVESYIAQRLGDVAKKLGVSPNEAKDWVNFDPDIENFVAGVTSRITERLKQNKIHARVRSITGVDLVPINKFSLVTQALIDQHDIRLVKQSYSAKHAHDPRAHTAGQAAGNDARFNKPVNNGGKVKMLPNGRNAY